MDGIPSLKTLIKYHYGFMHHIVWSCLCCQSSYRPGTSYSRTYITHLLISVPCMSRDAFTINISISVAKLASPILSDPLTVQYRTKNFKTQSGRQPTRLSWMMDRLNRLLNICACLSLTWTIMILNLALWFEIDAHVIL